MIEKMNPYLTMNGNAQEAIRFYEQVLGAQVLFVQTFGSYPEQPEPAFPEYVKDWVAHARVMIGGTLLMFSDNYPAQFLQAGNQTAICITTNDIEETKKYYEALQQGGQVHVPLQRMPFSPGYAMVTDKFGVVFKLYTEVQR